MGFFFTVNLSESMDLIFIYSFSFPDIAIFLDNNHVLSPIIRNYIYNRSSNTVLKVTLNIFTQSILLWKNQYKNVKSHIFNPKKWINILQCQNLYFPKNRFDALKKKDVQWWCNQSPAKNINIQSDPFVRQTI